MFLDVIIGAILLIALFLGYQRGVIQPLMAEIFFFGTLLLVFRFHDQYTSAMQTYVHISAILSVFVAVILAIVMGAVGGGIGGMFHRIESIRGIDGLLGVFVHVAVTLVVIYLAISALVVLDNAFEPTIKSATLTLALDDVEIARARQARVRVGRHGRREDPVFPGREPVLLLCAVDDLSPRDGEGRGDRRREHGDEEK
jgi:uncharacterized membrane protein required for colicin V production